MAEFEIGDRVRAKHDHRFAATIEAISISGLYIHVRKDARHPGGAMPASWFECVPEPPKHKVPVSVVLEVLHGYFQGDYHERIIVERLADRGYESCP